MIFITGVARSGTTILYQLLSQHPDLAYFCTAWKKDNNRLMLELRKKRLTPLEGWIWHMYGETEYITEKAAGKKELIDEINNCKQWWNRKDFLGKYPSLCLRLRWINSILPNALYVIINRDRNANLQSLSYHMNCSISDAEQYRNHFKLYLDKDKHILKNKIELQYENFVKDPRYYIKKILELDGKQITNNMEIPKELPNMNFRHGIKK